MMSLDELSFELERFEWQGEDRLEVRGRWYGVRGHRFMRPTLHVKAGGRRKRMIPVRALKHSAPDPHRTPAAPGDATRHRRQVPGLRRTARGDAPRARSRAGRADIAARPRADHTGRAHVAARRGARATRRGNAAPR